MRGNGGDDGFSDLFVVGLVSVFAHDLAAVWFAGAFAEAAGDGFGDECGCAGGWRSAGGAQVGA